MDRFTLDAESVQSFNSFVKEERLTQIGVLPGQGDLTIILSNKEVFTIPNKLVSQVTIPESSYDRILYGKNGLEGIVAAEVDGDNLVLFCEQNGKLNTHYVPNKMWVCSPKDHNNEFSRLSGASYYKYLKNYSDVGEWYGVMKSDRYRFDLTMCYCPVESNFITQGYTFFKGIHSHDVSVLSFDIETTGLTHNQASDVLIISNTFRRGDHTEQKLFDFKKYKSVKDMLLDWCKWVREKDPSIMLGHNIYNYDLPYLNFVASQNNTTLELGRDKSELSFSSYKAKFRKEGQQFYEYYKPIIYGRQLIDTQFLAYKYDVATRKYASYGLKAIIKAEGLEKEGRTVVDASKIKRYAEDPAMWEKVCQYALEDSEDALKLFDLMAPSFFYLNQMVPKTFEAIINGASGSQLNSMMLRAYLQNRMAIPRASDRVKFAGATSGSIPGVYRNCIKWDVASLYPSIMVQYNVTPTGKDPNNYFQHILKSIRNERLKNKKLAKQTGEKYYNDLQESQKIVANSLYGFLGAGGLNFNDPKSAAFITEKGREILETSIQWATGKKLSDYKEFLKKTEVEEEIDGV